MFDLSDKVALVTGASSGIGRASATALANQGASVVLTARRLDRLKSLEEELISRGKTAISLQMDVLKNADIKNTIDKSILKFGRLDILVNNAGIYLDSPILELSESNWDSVIDTNLKAYALMSQYASLEMTKRSWGRIINIGSIAMGGQGFGIPGGSAYASSKAAIVGLTESLAAELAPHGILVNCIAPGLIDTEMTHQMLDKPEIIKQYLDRIPLKRPGKPEEIASAVVFLSSDEASYVTGSTFVIDGGWLSS